MRGWKITILLLSGLFLFSVMAAKSAQPTYVGAQKCKICHQDEYKVWSNEKHSKAWDALKPEEQKKAECVKCHTTGGAANPNVQCEACHGPGSEYSKPIIMNKAKWQADPAGQLKLAMQAGLIKPDEKVCTSCHNKQSPNFKPFNFEEYKAKIKHWK